MLDSVVSVIPNYPETEISSEVLLRLEGGQQLLVSSDYGDAETPFRDTEDDSVLSIVPTEDHEAFCNIEGIELASIKVHEPIISVDLIVDETSIPDKKETACMYLVGVMVETDNHQFNIWKDLMTGFYLHADYHQGRTDGLYSPDERWDDYDSPIRVRRIKLSVFDGNEAILYDQIVKG